MKLNIDTENKTIKINETVNLKELNDTIKKLLPNNWEEYDLIVDTITIPQAPDIHKTYPWIKPYDVNPYDQTYPDPQKIWYTTDSNSTTNKK